MFVPGICTKCGKTGVLDIGDKPIEEAKKLVAKMEFGECKFGGWHVELGKLTDYVKFNWEKLFEDKEIALRVAEDLFKKEEVI